jgi:transcriptional regulator with XRE-family HTH domain
MRTRRRSTIIVVGGALAVASVGYGLGTQADDGTAVAGGGQTSGEQSRRAAQPPGFAGLASALGVDADKLAQALSDFRASEEGNRRDDFSASLADALGVPADKVSAALERLHKQHEARDTARLAGALGVDANKLQAALDRLMQGSPRPPDEFAQALADELGVDVADVRRALFERRPEGDRRHEDHALPLRRLATELGVSRADLRKAFRELRPRDEGSFEQHNAALAKFLADRFDLSAAEVAKRLDALPHPVRPDHGGRPGPGGPGPGRGFGGPGPSLGGPGMYPAPQPG